MRILLSNIKETAKYRPEGYYEDVLAHGVVNGEYVDMDLTNYRLLLKKYMGQAAPQKQCCGKVAMPPITTTLTNAAMAGKRLMSRVIEGQEIKVSAEVMEQRRAICSGCEFYNKELQRCGKCGCFTQYKTMLASESCPEKLW